MYASKNAHSLDAIHAAVAEYKDKKTISFYLDTYFIPFIFDWKMQGSKIIGTMIIVEKKPEDIGHKLLRDTMPSEKKGLGDKNKIEEDTTPKIQITPKAIAAINYFADCLLSDLRRRLAETEYLSLIKLSRREFLTNRPRSIDGDRLDTNPP